MQIKTFHIPMLRRSVLITLLVCFCAAFISACFFVLIFDVFQIGGYRFRGYDIWTGMLVSFFANLLFEIFTSYTRQRRKLSLGRKNNKKICTDDLRLAPSAYWKSELQQRFLCDCFETLSFLLKKDPYEADDFLFDLSKVFRTWTKDQKKELTELNEALQAFQSYFDLLSIRLSGKVNLDLEINKIHQQWLIPTLCIELLIESMVNNSFESFDVPFNIDIVTTDSNRLIIYVKLNSEETKKFFPSAAVASLQQLFLELSQPSFRLFREQNDFIIVLPLIKPESEFLIESAPMNLEQVSHA